MFGLFGKKKKDVKPDAKNITAMGNKHFENDEYGKAYVLYQQAAEAGDMDCAEAIPDAAAVKVPTPQVEK